MPATRIRHRRPSALLGVLALSVAVLAGCSGQRDPSSYTGQVKTSFVASCWTNLLLDAHQDIKVSDTDSLDSKSAVVTKKVSKTELDAAKESCNCTYKVFTKHVPFGDFKKANDDLRQDGGKLPSSITKKLDKYGKACQLSSES